MQLTVEDKTLLIEETNPSTDGSSTHFVKRTDWNSIANDQSRGLPPTGKRPESESIVNRSRSQRNPTKLPLVRPVSFSERYDRLLIDHYQSKISSRSNENVRPIIPRRSPSIESSSELNSESSSSSSLSSKTCSEHRSRPRENQYSNRIDYEISSIPICLASPITSVSSRNCKCQETSAADGEKQAVQNSTFVSKDAEQQKPTPIRGCLKRRTASEHRVKKSVHFDRFSPTQVDLNDRKLTRASSSAEMDKIEKNKSNQISSFLSSTMNNDSSREEKANVNQETTTATYLHRPVIGTALADLNDIDQHESQQVQKNENFQRFFQENQNRIYHSDSSLVRSMNRSSISMSGNSALITIHSDQTDSINNALLFPPPHIDEQPSTTKAKKLQTSTLIISTPPQYHYYLYPTVKSHKNVSNLSMNSLSSSDPDEETFSSSTYSLANSTATLSKKSKVNPPIDDHNDISEFQQLSCKSSDDSIANSKTKEKDGNRRGTPTSSSPSIFNPISSTVKQNSSKTIPPSKIRQTLYEQSQASYSELLREKSRFIAHQRPMSTQFTNVRSKSKDALVDRSSADFNSNSRNFHRPKSVSATRIQSSMKMHSSTRDEPREDFQSKRDFFENQMFTSKCKPVRLSPVEHSSTLIKHSSNETSSRHDSSTKSDSVIRTATKYVDSLNSTSYLNRKPVRIVKAIQRSINPTMIDQSPRFTTEYMRDLFPKPDDKRRQRARTSIPILAIDENQNRPGQHPIDSIRINQHLLNEEFEMNATLGRELLEIIKVNSERIDVDKFHLHFNEIDTITSVLIKLAVRLAKIDNDLSNFDSNDEQTKNHLRDQRLKIQQKYDEAKYLKEGIDRRNRFLTATLEKYFSKDQLDDYEYFIRMKSTLLMDKKDLEEQLVLLEKQSLLSPSTVNSQSHFEAISMTA